MKVIGIDINKKRAIYIALEKNSSGELVNITRKTKYVEIDADQDQAEIKQFLTDITALFDLISPDKIAILTRQTKGRFSASPFSFKLEALIQLYENATVEFIAPKTLNAYFKKNEFTIEIANNYQENAAKLAQYLINN